MKSSTITRLFSTAAVLGALAAPAVADDEGITLPGASAEVTVDYVTNYFFRGYEQQLDEGIIIQPGGSFTIPVVDDVTATVGTWASWHTEIPAGADGNLYETDIYASLDGSIGDLAASLGYTLYTYPNAGGNGVHELSASLGFDDSEYLGDFAFSPYAMVAVEIDNTNTAGVGTDTDNAVYLEVGGAFSLDSLTEGTFAEVWTWELPVVFGFSIDDYYTDESSGSNEFWGYTSVGVAGAVPLSEYLGTDEYVGAWDLGVGLAVLFINGDVDANLTDNGGSTIQVIGTVGISRTW